MPPSSDYDEFSEFSVELAGIVCANCHRRKKKCDKKLPSCSQCIKQLVKCRYTRDVPTASVLAHEEVQVLQKRLREAESIIHSIRQPKPHSTPAVAASNGSTQNIISLSNLGHASGFAGEGPWRLILANSLYSPDIQHTIRRQVMNIVLMKDNTVLQTLDAYFLLIHGFVPIISKKRAYDTLVYNSGDAPLDYLILLLTLYLIIQIPSLDDAVIFLQTELLKTTKELLRQVHVLLKRPTLALIQAAVLIAMYEHLHGSIEAAVLSIEMGARMAISIGLHRSIESSSSSKRTGDEKTWLQKQEEINTWWGVVIRQRFIALEFESPVRLRLTPNPPSSSILPIEVELWTAVESCSPSSLTPPNPRPLNSLTGIGDWARQAQVSSLVTQILEYITPLNNATDHFFRADDYRDDRMIDDDEDSEEDEDRWKEYISLDNQLQDLLRHLLNQPIISAGGGGGGGTGCGSLTLTVVSLFRLHRYQLHHVISTSFQNSSLFHTSPPDATTHMPEHVKAQQDFAFPLLALHTTATMASDVADVFMSRIYKYRPPAVSPNSILVYRSACYEIIALSRLQRNLPSSYSKSIFNPASSQLNMASESQEKRLTSLGGWGKEPDEHAPKLESLDLNLDLRMGMDWEDADIEIGGEEEAGVSRWAPAQTPEWVHRIRLPWAAMMYAAPRWGIVRKHAEYLKDFAGEEGRGWREFERVGD